MLHFGCAHHVLPWQAGWTWNEGLARLDLEEDLGATKTEQRLFSKVCDPWDTALGCLGRSTI